MPFVTIGSPPPPLGRAFGTNLGFTATSGIYIPSDKQEYTFAAWVYKRVTSATAGGVVGLFDAPGYWIYLAISSDVPYMQWYREANPSIEGNPEYFDTLPLGKWNLVHGVLGREFAQAGFNGRFFSEETAADTSGLTTHEWSTLSIGETAVSGAQANPLLSTTIAAVSIYDRVLSKAELLKMADGGSMLDPQPFALYELPPMARAVTSLVGAPNRLTRTTAPTGPAALWVRNVTRRIRQIFLPGAVGTTTLTSTHVINGALQKAASSTHLINAALRKDFTSTHNVDATLVKEVTAIHSIDSAVQKTDSKVINANAALRKKFTSNVNTDAALSKENASTYLINAALQKTDVEYISVDSSLQKEFTSTVSIESALQNTFASTVNIQAALQKQASATVNIDVDIEGIMGYVRTHSINAALQKGLFVTYSIDAALEISKSSFTSIDTVLMSEKSVSTSIDGALLKTLSHSVSIDSSLQSLKSTDVLIDSALSVEKSASLDIDSILAEGTRTDIIYIDAALSRKMTSTINMDAAINEASGYSTSIVVWG